MPGTENSEETLHIDWLCCAASLRSSSRTERSRQLQQEHRKSALLLKR